MNDNEIDLLDNYNPIHPNHHDNPDDHHNVVVVKDKDHHHSIEIHPDDILCEWNSQKQKKKGKKQRKKTKIIIIKYNPTHVKQRKKDGRKINHKHYQSELIFL